MAHLAPLVAPLILIAPVLVAAAILLLVLASLYDIAARIIPDEICAALAVVGLLLRLADGRLLHSIAAASVIFAILMLFCLHGWIGGGDVKLLSASVLLVPPALVPSAIFFVGIAGGALALTYILLRRVAPRPGPRPRRRLARICRVELRRIRRGGPLPYGVGIAAGCSLVLLGSMP